MAALLPVPRAFAARRGAAVLALLALLLPATASAQPEAWDDGGGEASAPGEPPAFGAPTRPDRPRVPPDEPTQRSTSAPMRGIATPARALDVPPDPQAGIDGAVEYRPSGGGLVSVGEYQEGAPDDEGEESDEDLPDYKGVIPGVRETADPFRPYQGRERSYITWIGYEPSIDRVFVQLSKPVDYTISKGPRGQLIVDLHGARVATTNNTRPLDTTHFNTVVASVKARAVKGGDARVTITLKEHSTYRLERKGRYIYVYFRG